MKEFNDYLPEVDHEENFCITVPIRIVSEANITEHWIKKHKRRKKHKEAINFFLSNLEKCLPCHIILTRIAPRELDGDNLVSALKHVRDVVSDRIIPGLAPGRSDSDKRITWQYEQKKGKAKFYALKIEIQKKGEKYDNNSPKRREMLS